MNRTPPGNNRFVFLFICTDITAYGRNPDFQHNSKFTLRQTPVLRKGLSAKTCNRLLLHFPEMFPAGPILRITG